ncbi:hypothetical protein G7Z17_g3395 [Cylindrodendrum hubeiense]|uniref:C2H2-type domain-containing protein n=1 Tax=Cylindrodendrum hubeiense TaxID=595255 RepID=A0A9P5HB00_9HYPO|nr:hypothetical protein G7Z17_g3395 [Cylindrodendrum hubeiense]
MDPSLSQSAIDQLVRAPEHQIRAILLALCDDGDVSRLALKHFAAVRSFDDEATGRKRKAVGDLFVCVQCDSPFSEEDNADGACQYHSGSLALDFETDVWADADEAHGDLDTPENREDFLEGFVWICCEKDANGLGCTKGKHAAHSGRFKKALGDPDPVKNDAANFEEEDDDGDEGEDEDEDEE